MSYALSLIMADLADSSTSSDWVIVLPGHPDYERLAAQRPKSVRLMDETDHLMWRLGLTQYTFNDMEALPRVSAVFADGTANRGAAAHWGELLVARPDLAGAFEVTLKCADAHGHGPRSMWTVTIWVTEEIAGLIDRPDPNWQLARSAPSVGNYNSRYQWAGAVLDNPKRAREQSDRLDAEVNAYFTEQSLWQEAYDSCPLPWAMPQEVPSRRKIGSMGFAAWKAAYDAAVQANKQHQAYMDWCNDYVDKRS